MREGAREGGREREREGGSERERENREKVEAMKQSNSAFCTETQSFYFLRCCYDFVVVVVDDAKQKLDRNWLQRFDRSL